MPVLTDSGLTDSGRHVLILGGTGEARRLAEALVADALAGQPGSTRQLGPRVSRPEPRVTSSLAGRVRAPVLPPGEVRIGGFGGPDGLAAWLVAEQVDAVIDATHPFAERMTSNAVAATSLAGIPLLVLRRPGWTSGEGDCWYRVPSLPAAAAALGGLGERVLLTTGRQGLAAFAGCADHWFLVRSVDPPEPPTPARMRTVLDRGPFTVAGETELMRDHRIDVVVTKDSGGDATVAKLVAARGLGLPVVMVDRPSPPADVPQVGTVDAALAWLTGPHRAPGSSPDRGQAG